MSKKDARPAAPDTDDYGSLLGGVSALLEEARRTSARAVNVILTATYWEIGRRIVEFEQSGKHRAAYGKRLLERLARDLAARFGRGFGYSNLNLIRQFYITYEHRRPNLQSMIGESPNTILQAATEESAPFPNTPVHQLPPSNFVLSWTHYVRLLPLQEQAKRDFYSESYYLDLLLYHRRLRCLVAIELKVGKFTHADAGQMNLYLNYLRENDMLEGEAPPLGLILCAEKDEAVAHYALGGLSNRVFASRYKLQLPDPDVLRREIEAERRRLEARAPIPKKRRRTDGL